MGKPFFKFSVILTVFIGLTGCVIVINNGKPTEDEQTLMNIQAQASQEVVKLNQKIQESGVSFEQIPKLINDAKKTFDENLKKIEELKLPERAKKLAEKTKEYITQAQKTYEDILAMSGQAGAQAEQLINKLKNMSQPLLDMAQQMEQLKLEFLNELQKAAQA